MAQQMHILAIDQSTTGSAAFVFDRDGRVVASASREITQYHLEPGWVSHDPEELFQSVVAVSREAIASAGIEPQQLAAFGITNQRETTVVWGRRHRRARRAGHRMAMPAHRPSMRGTETARVRAHGPEEDRTGH